jgi:hypothetical protein
MAYVNWVAMRSSCFVTKIKLREISLINRTIFFYCTEITVILLKKRQIIVLFVNKKIRCAGFRRNIRPVVCIILALFFI